MTHSLQKSGDTQLIDKDQIDFDTLVQVGGHRELLQIKDFHDIGKEEDISMTLVTKKTFLF
jgi:hypothetical protein